MKKLMFVFFLASMLTMLFSCQPDNLLPTDTLTMGNIANSTQKEVVTTSDLPSVITTHVAENYAPLQVELAWHVMDSGYEIMLEDGQLIYFNEMGNCIGEGDMHSGEGGMGGNNGGGMHGNNGGMGGGMGGSMGNGNCNNCMGGDTIPAADLPQAVLDYVSENYPEEIIVTVVVHPHGNYSVELSSGTVLMFDDNGEFMHACDGEGMGGGWGGATISVEDLPAAVLDYVTEHYPDATIESALEKHNGYYFLHLSNGEMLLFDADGNILFDSGN
jgi:putative PepSY-like beta-lactamase-inhibitor